jgi:G:T/U-mismatch repair DNA glycosylase
MACEQITIDGQRITTLKELVRPGLRAVIVGLNPALKSVALGHYWQALRGKLMWSLFG